MQDPRDSNPRCRRRTLHAALVDVDIADTGSNAVLIENCHNVTIAAQGGTVRGPGDIRIAAREEFANTSDITLADLRVIDSAIIERPCAINTIVRDVVLEGSRDDTC